VDNIDAGTSQFLAECYFRKIGPNLQAFPPESRVCTLDPRQKRWLTSSNRLVTKQEVSTFCAPLLHRPFRGCPQFFHMKIKPQQLEQLSQLLVQRYRDKELITGGASDSEIKATIAAVISANFAAEEAIENEARQMLAAHAGAARNMDPYKMFLIAKQKLAAKKGFIL
jgi:hypothetical protein